METPPFLDGLPGRESESLAVAFPVGKEVGRISPRIWCWPRVPGLLCSLAMQIHFPTREYAGYIFDCDGTLIDSMPVHYRAWVAALENAGFSHGFAEDLFYSLGGAPTARIIEILNERHGTELEPHAIAHAKEDVYLELLEEVEPIEQVVAFAREVVKKGHPVSVASGGMRHVVDRALKLAGLDELFPIVITPEDVTHGKPAPDMFLLAAQRMGVAAGECVVFEDADFGRLAAEAAGMDCVMIPLPHQRLGTGG
jgi:beta-phosphoglucomutase family hydrolase